jgi:hypothetical protein
VRAEPRRRAANVDRHEPARVLDASEQERQPNAQEANERAVDSIPGERCLGGLEQAACEPEVARRERDLATRGEDARTHRIARRQAPLRAPEQLLRGAILAELRHGHPTQRERGGVLAHPDEAQRAQGIEERQVSRGGREIGVESQWLLPGGAVSPHTWTHESAWRRLPPRSMTRGGEAAARRSRPRRAADPSGG